MNNQQNHPTPASIMQIGTGFWASKVLLSAVKFKIFTLLAEKKSMSAYEIKSHVGFNCTNRNVLDYLDTLTALGFLNLGKPENIDFSCKNPTSFQLMGFFL